MFSFLQNFKWEGETYWFEMIRMDELGLPAWLNHIVPDKFTHFSSCLLIPFIFYVIGKRVKILKFLSNRIVASVLPWLFMMTVWEIWIDGCLRHGASWRDMIANTLGMLVAYWWLGNTEVGQLNDIERD